MQPVKRRRRPVPAKALIYSVLALIAPIVSLVVAPDWTQVDQGMLVWLAALIPAFLLAYYRGSEGVAIALAGGMAVISATQASVKAFGVQSPDWDLLLGVVVIYLGISLGIALLSELLKREREAAEQLALVDRLTGIPNRRHAEVVLDAEFAAASRGGRMAVAVFDLDQFKKVNDNRGHAWGDRVLRKFAEILEHNTRQDNLSARFGGEEFVSVLRNSDADGAFIFADRVRQSFEDVPFPWGEQTVSCGIATWEKGMGSWELLLAAADRALYMAKATGRNRVVVTQSSEAANNQLKVSTEPMLPEDVPPGEGQSVVVVEDDEHLLHVMVRVLKKAGYSARGFVSPHEMLDVHASGDLDVDLLVAQMVYPDLNGLTLVDLLTRREKRGMRVIYTTSIVHKEIEWAGLPGEVIAILDHPVDPDRFRATVHRALQEPVTALT